MKRAFALAAILLFVTLPSFAQATRRYVVGVRPNRDHVAIARSAMASERGTLATRDFQDFRYLDAFSAELTDSEAAALRSQPGVRFVEKEIPVHAFELAERPREKAATRAAFHAAPNYRDPNVQTTPYGITMVDAPNAWIGARGEGTNVAIIDTGIDYTHPDLKDQFAGGYNEIAKSTDPFDDNGHGTHVAGIIAAEDNSIGVVGVAPAARLWSVKVLDSQGNGSTINISAGINWVLAKKAEVGGNWVINMSLGICADPSGTTPDGTQCATAPPLSMQDACQKAADGGILIFAASGNDSDPSISYIGPIGYPAALPSVTAVGAVDESGTVASFSNQGPQLAVVAPGVSVLSTFLVGKATDAFVTQASSTYDAGGIVGSKTGTASGNFVFCGFGGSAAEFPPAVQGKIALVERGNGITFNAKTKNALAAGAIGVVIYNCSLSQEPTTCSSDSDPHGWTLISKLNDGVTDNPADLAFNWPVALGVSRETGEALRANATAAVTEANIADDYATLSGTSMATPHAAGLAALVWSAAPNANAATVREAILATSHDLGVPGQDNAYGNGLIDAFAAAKLLDPGAFQMPITGRRILRRGH